MNYIHFDQDRFELMIKKMVDARVEQRLEMWKEAEKKKTEESEPFFFSSKELCKYLNMSWNSITEHLLYEPGFPSVRNGTKWLFPKKEVEKFMDNFYQEVRNNGGDIVKLRKKKDA